MTEAARAALNRGDARAARDTYQQLVAAGAADVAVWFGLSRACLALGDLVEEGVALDHTLRLDANHLPALIAKGDLCVKLGDRRSANVFFNAGLQRASVLTTLTPEWTLELRRITAMAQSFKDDYEAHLLAAMSAAGVGAPGTERFAHAMDLLLGKKAIFHQRPKYFFFPELPEIQFFDRQRFSWVAALERHWEGIRAEARAVLDAGAGIEPYIQTNALRPSQDTFGLRDKLDWGAFFLMKDGATVAANAARCPRTVAALRDVPLCRIGHRTPSVLFSVLRPGTRIPPHHGFMNARFICHLPLIVPPRCGLRVGNESRTWREGETVIFDDSIEHEAWNGSDEPRVVLIFDVWRPELSARERELVTTMLTAIDRFDGAARSWVD